MYWDWTDVNPLVQVVAVVFTSTCGIMEGANLSGDLKDSAKSLPKGTLSAVLTAFTTYVLFTTFLAMCYERQALRCEYLILQKTAVSPYVVVFGIATATLSTSLGALFGAARILQVCRFYFEALLPPTRSPDRSCDPPTRTHTANTPLSSVIHADTDALLLPCRRLRGTTSTPCRSSSKGRRKGTNRSTQCC